MEKGTRQKEKEVKFVEENSLENESENIKEKESCC